MNKYEVTYDECMKLITAPIVLAMANSVIENKGKILFQDPETMQFTITMYHLIPYDRRDETGREYTGDDLYYNEQTNSFFVKDEASVDISYDLNDAISIYNSIVVLNDSTHQRWL